MKFRHFVVLAAALLVLCVLAGGGAIVATPPRAFDFLGDGSLRASDLAYNDSYLEAEASLHLVNRPVAELLPVAREELEGKGFRAVEELPKALFRRGRRETVELHSAAGCRHLSLIKDVPEGERASWTVVKIVDPRVRRALHQHFVRFAMGGDGKRQ